MSHTNKGIYMPLGMEGFELCHPIHEEDFEKINIEINGKSKVNEWDPVSMELIQKENGKPLYFSDSPWLGAHAMIFREKSLPSIREMMTRCGEFLPLECQGQNLVIYNPGQVDGALDEAESSILRFSDGGIMLIREYKFFEKNIEGVDIFKIPNMRVSPTFLSHRFVAEWNKNGLKGLEFKQVWRFPV
jgi:hypothetical protein